MNADLSNLPTRRLDVRGLDHDGTSVILSFSISQKLYRCPGCHDHIAVGSEHVVVRYDTDGGGWHQHWHRACARSMAATELRTAQPWPAGERGRRRPRGRRRGGGRG